MSTLKGTTMHPQHLKKLQFNGANLSKHKLHVVNTDIY